jgi:hypothetical protein
LVVGGEKGLKRGYKRRQADMMVLIAPRQEKAKAADDAIKRREQTEYGCAGPNNRVGEPGHLPHLHGSEKEKSMNLTDYCRLSLSLSLSLDWIPLLQPLVWHSWIEHASKCVANDDERAGLGERKRERERERERGRNRRSVHFLASEIKTGFMLQSADRARGREEEAAAASNAYKLCKLSFGIGTFASVACAPAASLLAGV